MLIPLHAGLTRVLKEYMVEMVISVGLQNFNILIMMSRDKNLIWMIIDKKPCLDIFPAAQSIHMLPLLVSSLPCQPGLVHCIPRQSRTGRSRQEHPRQAGFC